MLLETCFTTDMLFEDINPTLFLFKIIKSLTLYSMFHYKSTLYHLPPRVLVSILGLLTPSAEAAAAMKK